MEKVTDRFLRYVQIDTQSDEEGTGTPTTEKQHELARLLVEELTKMGAEETYNGKILFITKLSRISKPDHAPLPPFTATGYHLSGK
jgi:di/tripeptidase